MPALAPSHARLHVLEDVDRDFRARHVSIAAPPTRFYLNLTETCNLRCQHCITFAPERTASRTGRVMSLEVLAAIGPHLRHATYVGLTHAGEPITAPVFVPLLERLRREATGVQPAVHVLSNGLALTERRFSEACDLGVNSWSISVDGMSAASHDALRVGSRVERLLERITALAALRRVRFPRVRLGIAWTITRANLGELEALLRFAASAGVDWVKLEEMVPVNGVAAAAAAVDPGELALALSGARTLAAELGVPLLDHTRALVVWKCLLNELPEMAAASRLDDLVNRMEINPCRLPYELVCIEPNGDVKPIDFFHHPAGNVLRKDLREIWNSPLFALARSGSLSQRLCGAAAPYCPSDPGPERW